MTVLISLFLVQQSLVNDRACCSIGHLPGVTPSLLIPVLFRPLFGILLIDIVTHVISGFFLTECFYCDLIIKNFSRKGRPMIKELRVKLLFLLLLLLLLLLLVLILPLLILMLLILLMH